MVISYVLLDLLFPKLPENKPLSLCNKILKLQDKLSKIEVVRGIVFCTGHYPTDKFNGVEVMQVLAMSGMALSD